MYISTKDWLAFVNKMSALNKKAAEGVKEYIMRYGFADTDALVGYCYGLADYYGTASAALAASMYDAIAELEGKFYQPAELAPSPSYGDVAKAVRGVLKNSVNSDEISGAVARLVKRAGQDTMLNNGLRDGAEFAWVPNGDTCAFCITLASRGWQPISTKALKNGHAEHIHANCDCSYVVRHSPDTNVRGYDPDKYLEMYNAGASVPYENGDDSHLDNYLSPKDKINGMRRAEYAKNKNKINAQHREAYALRKEAIEAGEIEE